MDDKKLRKEFRVMSRKIDCAISHVAQDSDAACMTLQMKFDLLTMQFDAFSYRWVRCLEFASRLGISAARKRMYGRQMIRVLASSKKYFDIVKEEAVNAGE